MVNITRSSKPLPLPPSSSACWQYVQIIVHTLGQRSCPQTWTGRLSGGKQSFPLRLNHSGVSRMAEYYFQIPTISIIILLSNAIIEFNWMYSNWIIILLLYIIILWIRHVRESLCSLAFLPVCLSVCPSVCLSICLSVRLSVHLSVCLSICLCVICSTTIIHRGDFKIRGNPTTLIWKSKIGITVYCSSEKSNLRSNKMVTFLLYLTVQVTWAGFREGLFQPTSRTYLSSFVEIVPVNRPWSRWRFTLEPSSPERKQIIFIAFQNCPFPPRMLRTV